MAPSSYTSQRCMHALMLKSDMRFVALLVARSRVS